MTQPTLTRAQSRRVDALAIERYGLCGLVLMENAGRGVVDRLCTLGIDGPVVVCCGKGNNAGDGFVIARHLDLRGYDVCVLLWADPDELTGDAATNFRILEKTNVSIETSLADRMAESNEDRMGREGQGGPLTADVAWLDRQLAGAAWIVDALLGTGARGAPRPPLNCVIERLNAAAAPIVAIDLPSGLDCDTGQPAATTIRAMVTCTFVAAKPGFFAPGADRYTGKLHVLDIGAPRKLLDEVFQADAGNDSAV